MNYIVMDLEWNQSNTGLEKEVEELPFEIIEIGAIKLTDNGAVLGEFNEIIKPQVYHELHHITSKLIHMQMQELERGESFPAVAERFVDWCGEEAFLFCTWGCLDLTELQRNLKFYNMTPLSQGPIAFLDVQKLFAIGIEGDRKQRRALEYAIDYLKIPKDIPFHRAFSDAYYTAKILQELIHGHAEVLKNVSYDVFCPPPDRKSEIRVQFDTYTKYISREFQSKVEAFADREISSTKCYLCHGNLRKRIKWFSGNGRHYYAMAYCEKHGFLKAKNRVHKTSQGRVYIVKTTKFISGEEAEALEERYRHIREVRKKRKKSRDYD